ncbi:hypothetical protein [Aliarcobacter butzleri]|uniref:hypothetical protein n=1 Tax=Aliarcobacter butzleri TaxID=28197 RepID=UPI001EDAD4FC|nr:hypothetical protein [Aliarcobacter butzleri]MCG3658622.1 hypothetical protein [Aliarcobacter butzleri]
MSYDKYCWKDTQEREEIRINKEINNTFVFPDTYRKLKDASSAKVRESNIPILKLLVMSRMVENDTSF